MRFIDSKKFRIQSNTYTFAVSPKALAALEYGRTVYMGIIDGNIFIAKEKFNSCIPVVINGENFIGIPIGILRRIYIDPSARYATYADNGDLFFVKEEVQEND